MADDTVSIGNRTTACFLMSPGQSEFSDDGITCSLRRSMTTNAGAPLNGVAKCTIKAIHRARGCIRVIPVSGLAFVTVTTNSGIILIGGRVGQCRSHRSPRRGCVGSVHSQAVTDRGAQTGGRGAAACEIVPMTALAVTEACRGLCCGTVDGRVDPSHGMADLAVAQGIVKTSHRHRQDDISRRRSGTQVTETANSGISRIGRRVLPCRRRLPREGVGRGDPMAGKAGPVGRTSGKISAVALFANLESVRQAGVRSSFGRCTMRAGVAPACRMAGRSIRMAGHTIKGS